MNLFYVYFLYLLRRVYKVVFARACNYTMVCVYSVYLFIDLL